MDQFKNHNKYSFFDLPKYSLIDFICFTKIYNLKISPDKYLLHFLIDLLIFLLILLRDFQKISKLHGTQL